MISPLFFLFQWYRPLVVDHRTGFDGIDPVGVVLK